MNKSSVIYKNQHNRTFRVEDFQMQNNNQTESPISYQNYSNLSQQSYENAVAFGGEINPSDDSMAILDSASYQSDSNSAFFNGPSSVDPNNMQTNFMFNDKYFPNSYTNQLDEISQTSTCSSQFDDSLNSRQPMLKMNATPKPQQQTVQLKSVPEEDSSQSVQSPVSIQQQQQIKSQQKPTVFTLPAGNSKAKRNESISKLYEMTDEPERKEFLDRLLSYKEKKGTPMVVCPSITKNMIDLFRIYNMVKERGGFVEVSKNLKWKEIATICGFPITTTTAYTLRKQYIKHLLEFECEFDLNGASSAILIEQTDSNKNKRKKQKAAQSSLSTSVNQQQTTPQQDNQLNYLSSPPPSSKQPNTIAPTPSFQQQQQSVYKHSSPNQPPNSNQMVKPTPPQQHQQPTYGNQQMVYNYEPPPHLRQQPKSDPMISYDQQQQFMNQITNDQLIYEPHSYPTNQQVINQAPSVDYNHNNTYYGQYETDGQSYVTTNAGQLSGEKTTTTTTATNQQYYPDSNQQQYNGNQYNYNHQYSAYPNNFNNPQQTNSVYTDSQRMSISRTLSTSNEQQLYSSKPPYQFTNNFDYTSLQPPLSQHRTVVTSQHQPTNYGSYYSHGRVLYQQQQHMIENDISAADGKQQQQFNAAENWQINNSTNNWNHHPNYYSSQQQSHAQQQFAIESPIQQKVPTHHLSKMNYYSNHLTPRFMPSNHYPLDQTLFNHHLSQRPMQPLQYAQHPIAYKIPHRPKYVEFAADCIESVKPKIPLTKRKLTPKDLPNYDVTRWIMSLKCGLLAESTQALNGFSIVSSDDSTHNQIKLNKYPRLLSHLMHYFKCFLRELFPDIFGAFVNDEKSTETNLNGTSSSDESQEQTTIELNLNRNQNSPSLIEPTDKMNENEVKYCNTNEFISTSLYPRKKSKVEQEPADSTTDSKPKTEGLKINYFDDFENEAKVIEVDTFLTIPKFKEDNNAKCICISTLIRNLSLVTGNEQELGSDRDLLFIIGKMLLYGHEHYEKKQKRDILLSDEQANNESSQDKQEGENKEAWWIEALNILQENAFVTLTQMSACLNFNEFEEELSLPILSGLLHWAICPSAVATDNFKYTSIKACSPKRLALECLAKLSICESNVDFLLATPPLKGDYEKSFPILTNLLSRSEEQIIRELALVLLHNFVMSDSGVAIAICSSTNIVGELFDYLMQYEENQHPRETHPSVVDSQSQQNLTLDMAKRAASCLKNLASIKENHSHFRKQDQKLQELCCSSVLDPNLSKQINEIFGQWQSNESQQQQSIIDQPVIQMLR